MCKWLIITLEKKKKIPGAKIINIDNCLKLGHKSLARNMCYFLFLITPSTVAEEGKWFKLFFNYSFFLSVKKIVFFLFFHFDYFWVGGGLNRKTHYIEKVYMSN